MTIRTYTELSRLWSYEDRFEYLKLSGRVGADTFGFDRYMNQGFYTSRQWRDLRNHVIARDLGCDLGVEGFEIYDRAYVHHMNPMTKDQLVHGDASVLDPEFLVTCTLRTHNAIHYGAQAAVPQPIERRAGDTKLW